MGSTNITIAGTEFHLNGRPTYHGAGIEGLLFNIRTVNATFDDTLGKVSWWDDDGSHEENGNAGFGPWRSPDSAHSNTERFISALPEYREHGILAINLNFQGGHPLLGKPWISEGKGSAGARPNAHRDFYHNSAFDSDGRLDSHYAERIQKVIKACDRLGMAVILQLFYFGQDTVFTDESAILAAADSAVDFVCRHDFQNVIIEVANEVMEGHFHHDILKPRRVREVIEHIRRKGRDSHGRELIVSTSEAALLNRNQWKDEEIDQVFEACDVVLLHGGDNIETGRVGDASELVQKVNRIRSADWFTQKPRPVLTNESHGQAAFEAMVHRGVSFGLHSILFQTMFPPKWGVWENETKWFFERVRELSK